MTDGYIKVAAASPDVRVADCRYNAEQIVKAAWRASTEQAQLLVTPELGITAYTCGDLFAQTRLLDEAESALKLLCRETADLQLLIVAGLPLRHRGKLFNCAAVIHKGEVLGMVPKSNLPGYGEFYEQRIFTPADYGAELLDSGPWQGVPFGTQLLFRCEEQPAFVLGVEICEDLWVPSPPSVSHALAGATVIANLSASSEAVGKAGYRKQLVTTQAARLACAYVYASAGPGESTTDLVFAGHNLIAENGELLAESAPFSGEMAVCDIDLERLTHERRRLTSYPLNDKGSHFTSTFSIDTTSVELTRHISPSPFVPPEGELDERCESILAIQAAGLAKRMAHIGAASAVIGISGGLDSSLALLVTARAFEALHLPPSQISAVTMPGFGTTSRTKSNAERLCQGLGASLRSIDITGSVRAHLAEIGHDESNHNVVYENAQARMRTMILMDIANGENGLVVGTGDLSELALGWATYNGDHMSMYAVNAGVPKTLLRHLVAYEARRLPALGEILDDVLATPVSPELLPPKDGEISQVTEALVGPYELHDFFLYYILRWGFAPRKVYRLAQQAFKGRYEPEEILSWLKTFYRRFFSQQYKRSCLPDGPKIGSVTLSPRGDWRMPSDASLSAWSKQLDEL